MLFPALFQWRSMRFFAPDDGGGGLDVPIRTTPSTPATDPAPPPPTSGGNPEPVKDGKAGDELRLTSAQLKERLDRAKESELSSVLKTLGVANLDDAKKALKEGQDALRARMSEQEKLQTDLAAAQQTAQDAVTRATQAETARTQALLHAEALSLMSGKFANPKAALKLLEMNEVDLTDPKFPGLSEAVEKLAKDEPWTLLTTKQNGKPLAPHIGPTNPANTGTGGRTDDERRKQYFGGGVRSSFFEGGGVKPSGSANKIGGG